jgi:hypothetical protein
MSQTLTQSPKEDDRAIEEILAHLPHILSMDGYVVATSFAPTASFVLRTDTLHTTITFDDIRHPTHTIQESLACLLCEWMHVVGVKSGPHYEPCSVSLTIDLPQLDRSYFCNFNDFHPSTIHSRLGEVSISTSSELSCCSAVIRADVTSKYDGGTEDYLDRRYAGCPLRVFYE